MNRLEQVVSETLADRALDIPEGSARLPSTGTRPSPIRTVLVSIAAAALLVGGFATVRANISPDNEGVASPASDGLADTDSVPDIRGLLGKDVGDALGLTPEPEDADGCYAFAEYDDPWGFCYDEVVAGDEAYHLLGRQINGHAPTEAGATYLAAAIELKAMMKGTIEYNAEREAVLLATLAEYEGDLSEGR